MDKLLSRRVFLQTAGNSLPFVAIILSLSGCDSMSGMEDDKESPLHRAGIRIPLIRVLPLRATRLRWI